MVRKIVMVVSVCVMMLSGMTAHATETIEPTVSGGDSSQIYADAIQMYADAVETYATALEVYQGTINTTYLQFFRDILNNVSITKDYFLYRSDQNTYTMIVGDIENNGNVFSMASGYQYTITSVSTSGYGNSYYSYKVQEVSDVYVDAENYMVYTNIGDYPDLIERNSYYDYATLYIIVVIGLCFIIRGIFKFTYRTR